mgnify:CR=1 FL=1
MYRNGEHKLKRLVFPLVYIVRKFEKEKEDKTMKWYNFETRFITLRDALRGFLKDNNIKYELSGAFSFYHFEIYTDSNGAEKINSFLDTQSFTNVPA